MCCCVPAKNAPGGQCSWESEIPSVLKLPSILILEFFHFHSIIDLYWPMRHAAVLLQICGRLTYDREDRKSSTCASDYIIDSDDVHDKVQPVASVCMRGADRPFAVDE